MGFTQQAGSTCRSPDIRWISPLKRSTRFPSFPLIPPTLCSSWDWTHLLVLARFFSFLLLCYPLVRCPLPFYTRNCLMFQFLFSLSSIILLWTYYSMGTMEVSSLSCLSWSGFEELTKFLKNPQILLFQTISTLEKSHLILNPDCEDLNEEGCVGRRNYQMSRLINPD